MGEFQRGWKIILCALVGIAFSNTIINIYTIGMLAPELARTFHWSMRAILFSTLVHSAVLVIVLPLVGALTDRCGARPVAIGSALCLSVALALMSRLQGSLMVFYCLTAASALGGAGTVAMTWSRMVALWFHDRRGLALGIALLGTGLGGAFLKPYTSLLIGAWGWRGAYLGLGLLPLATSVPLALAWFRSPAAASDRRAGLVDPAVQGVTTAQALRNWRFWALGFAFVPVAGTIGALVANMETVLRSVGIAGASVVRMVTCIGLFVIAGRLGGGYLLDKINAAFIGAVLIALLAVGCLLLAFPPVGPARAMLAIAFVGLSSGVEFDVMAFLAARLFGLRAYARIYGGLLMFFFVGGALGPFLFSAVYDATHSFRNALVGATVALALAAGAMLATSLRAMKAPQPFA